MKLQTIQFYILLLMLKTNSWLFAANVTPVRCCAKYLQGSPGKNDAATLTARIFKHRLSPDGAILCCNLDKDGVNRCAQNKTALHCGEITQIGSVVLMTCTFKRMASLSDLAGVVA